MHLLRHPPSNISPRLLVYSVLTHRGHAGNRTTSRCVCVLLVHVRRPSYDGRDEFSRMQQRNRTEHTQYLLRSPSHGDNFIMQSNFGASTNDHFAQKPPVAPAASTPPPVSPSFIPPPPPMPEQFLTLQSSSWSTLELPKRNGKLRPRLDIDLSKYSSHHCSVLECLRDSDRSSGRTSTRTRRAHHGSCRSHQ